MALVNELKSLKEYKCDEGKCMLTMYLNTDPANPDQQKGEWQIHLKNGLKRLEEYLTASGNEEEIKSFKKIRKKVEKEVEASRMNLQKSIILFASQDLEIWTVHYMQVPVETSFHWENHAVTDQLDDLQNKYPLSGIIMPNQHEVKIIEVSLGEVNDEKMFEFDPESEDWREKKGNADTDAMASGANHVDQFQDRMTENLRRFYKDIGSTVERYKKQKKWSNLYLVGEPEMVNYFEKNLKKKPTKVIHKNLNKSSLSKVMEEVYK